MTTKSTLIGTVVASLLLITAFAGPVTAVQEEANLQEINGIESASLQEANETTTETTTTPTESPECTPSQEPKLQVADLHTSDSVIEKGSPGRISGSIVLDVTMECPVMVQLTLNIPNNMYIQGESDVQSGGGGVITSTFIVEPGEAKDIAATVYGTELGQHTIVADITYFPVGHEEMAREIDGLSMTFTVEDPVEPNTETGSTQTGISGLPSTLQWLLGIVTVVVFGLLIVAGRKSNIRIRK